MRLGEKSCGGCMKLSGERRARRGERAPSRLLWAQGRPRPRRHQPGADGTRRGRSGGRAPLPAAVTPAGVLAGLPASPHARLRLAPPPGAPSAPRALKVKPKLRSCPAPAPRPAAAPPAARLRSAGPPPPPTGRSVASRADPVNVQASSSGRRLGRRLPAPEPLALGRSGPHTGRREPPGAGAALPPPGPGGPHTSGRSFHARETSRGGKLAEGTATPAPRPPTNLSLQLPEENRRECPREGGRTGWEGKKKKST